MAYVLKPRPRSTWPAAPSVSADPLAADRFYFNPRLSSFGYEYWIDCEGASRPLAYKRFLRLVLHVEV